jgi:uncharacterized membrane protein (DUF4010 family)
MSVALSPAAAAALLPAALAGAIGAAAVGLLPAWSQRSAGATEQAASKGSALHPREALAVASMLAVVAVLVGSAQRRFGDAGLGISVALAALADAHAPVASLASLNSAGALQAERFVLGVCLAVSANTLTRCTVAAIAGGGRYALRVSPALVSSLALAWAVAWWTVAR